MRRAALPLAASALALAGCQDRAAAPLANEPAFDLNSFAPVDGNASGPQEAGAPDPAADEAAIRSLIGRIYAPYANAGAPARDTATFYTAEVAGALQQQAESVDFDPFLGAPTYEAFEPIVGAVTLRDDTANVAITFTQIRSRPRDRPPIRETRRIQFVFKRNASDWGPGRGWKIAEVASPRAPSLRTILGLRPIR